MCAAEGDEGGLEVGGEFVTRTAGEKGTWNSDSTKGPLLGRARRGVGAVSLPVDRIAVGELGTPLDAVASL
jgi:hypothetical protein